VYFGTPDQPLFGWLHAPASASASGVGLVICNPFGNEAICAHRSLRHLAERAAHSGIAVLRFDYAGTGDSAGHDFEPDRVGQWVESIRRAADELCRVVPVTSLCFLGIRVGALLASLAAAERSDVSALIAVAPVVNGKAYVRELRLLQRASEAKQNTAPADTSDTIESAGFSLTAATQAALTAVDLTKAIARPAPKVLILDRAEMASGERWEQHLRATGVVVERASVHGFAEMMLDSHETVVPEEILAESLKYLQTLQSIRPTPSPAGDPPAAEISTGVRTLIPRPATPDAIIGGHAAPDTKGVEETACWFGGSSKLFGIVTAPVASDPQQHNAPPSRGIVLVNSGAVHHVGPNRLYTVLARHLAQQGHVVLRMDISGIGDSPTRAGAVENTVYSPHAVEDVTEAVNFLRQQWHLQDVRASGLCSGAYHSLKTAAAGAPVKGVVLINPLTFFWKEGMSLLYPEYRVAADIMRYRTNALRLGSWLKVLRGQVNLWESSQVVLRRLSSSLAAPLRNLARAAGLPLKDDLPSELRSIVRSGIGLRFVFAARDPGVELLRDQGGAIARKLRDRGVIVVDMIDDADHTFTNRSKRAQLATVLERALCS
jgi:alpha-beta hydrolase superfamily lysophospholipase